MTCKRLASSLLLLFPFISLSLGSPNRRADWARLPLAFETLPDGNLAARQGPHQVTLAAGRITTTLADKPQLGRVSVTSTLIGADQHVRPEGIEPLTARANYILGNNPARWRAGVPLFGRAIYKDVYPGVDLVFHGTDGALEYDFVVQPGANVRRIAFDISGASALRLAADGTLDIATSAGEIRWRKPEVYQLADGVRQEVAGHFVLHGRHVTFALGTYDRSRTLIVDPTLSYATYFGGSGDDSLRGMAVDTSGNVYITGSTVSNNLPVTSGAYQAAYHGGSSGVDLGGDAYVAKFTPAGALAYVTYVGGATDDVGAAIAVDSSGNAYITGYTDSTDFPIVAGAFQTAYQGAGGNKWFGPAGDAFVAKLNPAGSALIYSTYLGGSMDDRGTAIAVDGGGNAYIGGVTLSSNFPVLNAYQTSYKGGGGSPAFCCGESLPFLSTGDGFLAKLNPGGTALIYSTYYGGSLDDTVTALAIDNSGNVYLGGSTLSTDFPTLSAYQSHFAGAANADVQPVITMGDGWVAKFNSTGRPIFSTYLGGSFDDAVMGLAIDSTGAVYVTGFTSSADFPVTANAAQSKFAGPATLTGQRGFLWGDAFVAKLSPSGQSLVYSTFLGGSDDDAGMAIAVDSAGNAYIGGFSDSTDFPITSKTALQATFGGYESGATDPTGDGFLSQIGPDGNTLLFSTYYGGSSDDSVSSLALDAQGNVWFAGTTVSTNLPVTSNAVQHAFGGAAQYTESLGDGFVAKVAGLAASSQPGPVIASVVSGASFLPGIVPGSWVSVYGTNLSSVTDFWTIVNGQLPTKLDGVSVSVNGQPAYIEFVSSGQINLIAPDTGAGTMQVSVTNSAGTSPVVSATAATYGPAFFLWANQYAVATYQDYTYAVKNGAIAGLTTVPAKPGDVLILWGTGFGPTTPAAPAGEEVPSTATYSTTGSVTVSIGGVQATVYGAALTPGFAGLYQIAIQVPPSAANGDQPIVASVGGVSSPSSTLITVQQ
jgi:uncharacterized protein (TIGR03437 family)